MTSINKEAVLTRQLERADKLTDIRGNGACFLFLVYPFCHCGVKQIMFLPLKVIIVSGHSLR